MIQNSGNEEYLKWLRHDLLIIPQPRSLILAARYVAEHDPDAPIWVKILASGERMTANLVEEILNFNIDGVA